jgi:HK97 gp10 family phage protein
MSSGNAEILALIRAMGKIPKDVQKELRPALKKGAQPILMEARKNAAWSSRIPRATRIGTSFSKSKKKAPVEIVVSAKKAPHARPYENLGVAGTFRHPNWGRRDTPWSEQKARPFLFPAVESKGAAVAAELGKTVAEAARKNGWK